MNNFKINMMPGEGMMSGKAAARGCKVFPIITDNLNAGVFTCDREKRTLLQRENPLQVVHFKEKSP